MMDDIEKFIAAQREAQFLDAMSRLPVEEQVAFQQLMEWIVQRPKDAEPLTFELMGELLEDIKRENTRRRLGGKVGKIIPFKRPSQKA
ncbi:hypothetical protein ACFQUU_08855 [Herbaspirillum sp. GCM10030257]|uniref:hypothetical protein n=1 Tax=Herbaspirillum sp. GCM10030257 TaxID=3273393 RepID=UPI00360D688C